MIGDDDECTRTETGISTVPDAPTSTDGPKPGSAEPQHKYSCPQCTRSYKRVEHLQRHLQAHSDDRPYQCELCKASFQRSDVLSRHKKTCNGKRRRVSVTRSACTACSQSKRACDLEDPCGNCAKRDIICMPAKNIVDASTAVPEPQGLEQLIRTSSIPDDYGLFAVNMPNYEDVLTQPLSASEFNDVFFFGDQGNMSWAPQQQAAPWEITLGFLERFTRKSGLLDSFDCGTPEARAQCHTMFTSRSSCLINDDPLALKSQEIVDLVEEVVRIRPRNSAVTLTWCPDIESVCKRFFAPNRLRLYLDLYFAIWAPNVSFLHYPTFHPEGSKAVLLAAMAIVGATVSPNESDHTDAKMWFSCVEEMVFQDDDFCIDQETQSFPSPARLQALQAAYMVCLFQNWDGDDSGKRRIRRFRFNTLISVARDFGMRHARHNPIKDLASFSWQEFITREQLIRTLLWIFLLDTAFVIFHNSPPRIAIMEMRLQLGCNEACFQARTREECYVFLREQSSAGILLSSTSGLLCRGPIDLMAQARLADLGPFNLFVLISALHSMIFQVQQSFGYDVHMSPINNALDNWICIWQLYATQHANTAKHDPLGSHVTPSPDDMWRRIGFSKFAAEYWLLAKLITQRITAAAQKRQQELLFEQDVLGDGDLTDGNPDPSKLKYDETSMRQVNEMISHFQKVVIG